MNTPQTLFRFNIEYREPTPLGYEGEAPYATQPTSASVESPPPRPLLVVPECLRVGLFPCVPAAQIGSSLGDDYWLTLIVFGLVFVGGIAAFSLAMTGNGAVIEFEAVATPMAIGWALFVFGPLVTIGVSLLAWFVLVVGPGLGDRGDDDHYKVDNTKSTLAILTAAAQLIIIVYIVGLRQRMHNRAQQSQRFAFSCCCPMASLEETATFAKKATCAPQSRYGPLDEIPPFATVLQGV